MNYTSKPYTYGIIKLLILEVVLFTRVISFSHVFELLIDSRTGVQLITSQASQFGRLRRAFDTKVR